jgi:uncharacterized membrane protein
VCLRVLGIGKAAELAKFRRVFPWMILGALFASVSGLGLLAGYPAKALTNWVFYLKFACLISAALLLRQLARSSFDKKMEPVGLVKIQAAASFLLWIGGIAAGKLLLYTNSILLTMDLTP